MTPTAFDATEWLATFLASHHFRIKSIQLTIRTFATRGIQYRCDDGPWRDTLHEAIEAHKAKHEDAAE